VSENILLVFYLIYGANFLYDKLILRKLVKLYLSCE